MAAVALAIRKNKLLAEIALTENETFIARIEAFLAEEQFAKERLSKISRGVRKSMTIDELKAAQNYQAPTYEQVKARARAVKVEETIEELIATL